MEVRIPQDAIDDLLRQQGGPDKLTTPPPGPDLSSEAHFTDFDPSVFDSVRSEPQQTEDEQMNETREKYVKAKKEYEKASSLTGRATHLDISGKNRKIVQDELEKLEKEYRELRGEYIGSNIDRFLAERLKMVETQIANQGKGSKVLGFYRKLGEYNLTTLTGYKHFGQRLGRMVNARTAITVGLLAVGVMSGSAAVAGGALVGRRLLSGLASGVGTHDLVKNARSAYLRKQIKEDASLEEVEGHLSALEARGALDGTLDKIVKSDDYKKLLELRAKGFGEAVEGLTPEQIKQALEGDLKDVDRVLEEKYFHEKQWNKAAKVAAVGAGVFTGSGTAAKAFGGIKHMLGWGDEAPAPTRAGALHPTGAAASAAASEGEAVKMPGAAVSEAGAGTKPPGTAAFAPESSNPVKVGEYTPPGLKTVPAPEIRNPAGVTATVEAHLPKPEDVAVNHKIIGIRAGAKIDIIGNEAVAHAGGMGIEGSLLDMAKSTDKDVLAKYNSMIEWLKQQDYNKNVNDPGALVDRWVDHLAKLKGIPKDQFDRIFKGAVTIHSDGSLELGEVDFMPEPPVHSAVDAVQDSASGPKVNVEFGKFDPANLAEQANPNIHVDFEPSSAPDADWQPSGPGDHWTSASEQVVQSAREAAAETANDATTGLQLVLGERYDNFLKDTLHVSAKALNKIKDMTWKEFMGKNPELPNDQKFLKAYKGVYLKLKEAGLLGKFNQDSGISMKKALIELAKKSIQRKLI